MTEDVEGAKAPLLPLSSKLANGRLLPGSRRPTEDDEEAGHHLTQADGRPRSRCARTGRPPPVALRHPPAPHPARHVPPSPAHLPRQPLLPPPPQASSAQLLCF